MSFVALLAKGILSGSSLLVTVESSSGLQIIDQLPKVVASSNPMTLTSRNSFILLSRRMSKLSSKEICQSYSLYLNRLTQASELAYEAPGRPTPKSAGAAEALAKLYILNRLICDTPPSMWAMTESPFVIYTNDLKEQFDCALSGKQPRNAVPVLGESNGVFYLRNHFATIRPIQGAWTWNQMDPEVEFREFVSSFGRRKSW